MKKILFILIFTFPALFLQAQVVKEVTGFCDTTYRYDSITHQNVIDQVIITPYQVLDKIVKSVKLKSIDIVQQIVIAEGLYDEKGIKIEGTDNRYFFYLQRIPFTKLSNSEISILNNNSL